MDNMRAKTRAKGWRPTKLESKTGECFWKKKKANSTTDAEKRTVAEKATHRERRLCCYRSFFFGRRRSSWYGPLIDFRIWRSLMAAKTTARICNMRMRPVTAIGTIPTRIFWRRIHLLCMGGGGGLNEFLTGSCEWE